MRGINKVKNTIIIYESDFGNQQLPATSKLPSIGREELFLNITHRTSTCLILRIIFWMRLKDCWKTSQACTATAATNIELTIYFINEIRNVNWKAEKRANLSPGKLININAVMGLQATHGLSFTQLDKTLGLKWLEHCPNSRSAQNSLRGSRALQ